MSHKHQTKKTHIVFVEFDDVIPAKLASDLRYFGEGNSKNRKLNFDFEYCLECNYRLLDGKPIMTQGILDELEKYVTQAKRNNYKSSAEVTVQHSDFDILERLIKRALEFGDLRQKASD
ncbi:MAG: hypothetical protein M1540_01840 [Candidatus Bathyarchaeota archaeon]|nr:hypothetical protein [Chloroflexota bacterium]MCL5876538.1 hypothetical protein [Candidatus Bathyarchaeota archaeon]